MPTRRLRAALTAWDVDADTVEPIAGGGGGDTFLVTDASSQQWVAKLAYDHRENVEAGMAFAELLAVHGLRTASPRRTADGDLTVMVDTVPGQMHPLALLQFVAGEKVKRDHPRAPEIAGKAHGSLQAISARHLTAPAANDGHLTYLVQHSAPLVDDGWLIPTLAELAEEVSALEASIDPRWLTDVFDGPELLIDDQGVVGLVDFGVVRPQPQPFAIANQILAVGAQPGDARAARLIAAWLTQIDIDDAALLLVEPYWRVCVATYAKYAAYTLATGNEHVRSLDRTRATLDWYRQQLTVR